MCEISLKTTKIRIIGKVKFTIENPYSVFVNTVNQLKTEERFYIQSFNDVIISFFYLNICFSNRI